MKYDYTIAYSEDFQPVADVPTFDSAEEAFFRLAYMHEGDGMTVIRTDGDGHVYHRNGMAWEKIC